MNWKYVFVVEKMPVSDSKIEYLVFIDDSEALTWMKDNIDEYCILYVNKNPEWKDRDEN